MRKLPEEVAMQVSGQGWDLFWENITSYKKTLSFQLDTLPGQVIIKKWELEKTFNDMGHAVQLEQALADEFLLDLSSTGSKEVLLTINPNKLTYSEGFARSGAININPKSIVLYGPQSTLDQIADTTEITITDSSFSDEYDEEFEITELFDFHNITSNVSSGSVNVIFRVSELMPKQFNLDITMINYDPKDSLYVIPDERIKLNCLIPEGTTVDPSGFEVILDLEHNKFEVDTMLAAQLVVIPKFVQYPKLLDSMVLIQLTKNKKLDNTP